MIDHTEFSYTYYCDMPGRQVCETCRSGNCVCRIICWMSMYCWGGVNVAFYICCKCLRLWKNITVEDVHVPVGHVNSGMSSSEKYIV